MWMFSPCKFSTALQGYPSVMLAGTSCQLVINIDKTQVQRSKSTTVFNDSFFFFFFFVFFVAVVAVVMKKKKN